MLLHPQARLLLCPLAPPACGWLAGLQRRRWRMQACTRSPSRTDAQRVLQQPAGCEFVASPPALAAPICTPPLPSPCPALCCAAEAVYAALTCYESLGTFIPGLAENRCLARHEDGCTLQQVRGAAAGAGCWRGGWRRKAGALWLLLDASQPCLWRQLMQHFVLSAECCGWLAQLPPPIHPTLSPPRRRGSRRWGWG